MGQVMTYRRSKRKKCFKCETSKSISEFYRHAEMADGHLNKCKSCAKIDVLAHRIKNLEKIRESDRARGRLEYRKAKSRNYLKQHPEKQAVYKKRWSQKNKHKRRAHSRLWAALKKGIVVPGPCEKCGNVKSQAHHDNYDRPLEIRWLCALHHAEHHREERSKSRENLGLYSGRCV
jgi:uncharacterized OB-fold protein